MSSERDQIIDRLQEKAGEEFDNICFRLEEVLNDAQDAHGRPWALATLLELAGDLVRQMRGSKEEDLAQAQTLVAKFFSETRPHL